MKKRFALTLCSPVRGDRDLRCRAAEEGHPEIDVSNGRSRALPASSTRLSFSAASRSTRKSARLSWPGSALFSQSRAAGRTGVSRRVR